MFSLLLKELIFDFYLLSHFLQDHWVDGWTFSKLRQNVPLNIWLCKNKTNQKKKKKKKKTRKKTTTKNNNKIQQKQKTNKTNNKQTKTLPLPSSDAMRNMEKEYK